MPKNTFFNLPEEKREKILQCSKAEFSKFNFYSASINRIIKAAGISRGSFYQYFEDKEDLFIYLLNNFRDNIFKELLQRVIGQKYDLFDFQLLVFDYLTEKDTINEDSEFIRSIISNMDLKFSNHLIEVNNSKELLANPNIYGSLINLDKITLKTTDEFMALQNILITTLANELISYFDNIKTLETCRKDLIIKANLLKSGVYDNTK